ncbi:MAG: hypothetical protein LBQ12_11110 [Deltaproteobacteria bacterium]|jgi:hypothetical protein|nr:hypothetical protein [Deltaproteobacteria bacterium]
MLDFYRPSGKCSRYSLLVAATAAVAAAVLAPVYAVASLYAPYAHGKAALLANVALVACYGALTGLAAGIAVKFTRTLNPPLAGFLAAAGGWVGFALSWCAWLSLARRFGTAEYPGFLAVADFLSIPDNWDWAFEKPREFYELAREANSRGLWEFWLAEGKVRGLPLLCVWAAEFLLFTWWAAKAASRAALAPYSFEAGAYLRREPELRRGVAAPEDAAQLVRVLTGLASGDLTYLSISPVVPRGSPGFYVTLVSHEDAPWGTAEVSSLELKGNRHVRTPITKGAILTAKVMNSLRGRLAEGETARAGRNPGAAFAKVALAKPETPARRSDAIKPR